ncbi:shiftless antiviral inhibitor of ribosomal frameshifting protein homolog isoform X7 [Narcine bancroftii]|uniref:shiftless antiviral inhibitor of ribosomal frameshifting protein homolog isoform X7 n=1 Tax=Narcine bancroftii TaxID=1343680 RepID=UPI0038320291
MDQAQLQRRVQLEKSVRRFREMFQGNVPLELAVLLMKRYHNNYTLVTKHIILMFIDPETGGLDDDDRNDIEEDDEIKVNVAYVLCFQQAFRALKAVIQTLREEEEPKTKQVMAGLTVKNLDLFNQANEKLIPSKERQFSCSQCDRYWWRRVPARKQVSRCRHCKKKYDPVPYDKMWGYAEFNCQECGHNFGALHPGHPLRAPTEPPTPRAAEGSVPVPGARQHGVHRGHLREPGQLDGVPRGGNPGRGHPRGGGGPHRGRGGLDREVGQWGQ